MSAATIIDAMDEVVTLLLAAWVGKPLDVPNFKSVDEAALNPKADVWARLRIQHETGRQTGLRNVNGAPLFGRAGTIIVQVFVPLGSGLKKAYDEAEIVLGAFEGRRTPSDVWFRNCRLQEVGASGNWYQINVYADMTYDQRG